MIRAMIFDMDGTLVQTERLKSISYARAVQDLCPYPVTIEEVQEVYKEVVGRSREEVATTLVERFKLEPKARARMADFEVQHPWQAFVHVRLDHYQDFISNPDILRENQWTHNVELLHTARNNNCKTALATTSHCDIVWQVLRALSLEDQFEVVLAREDVEYTKPNPEIYQLAGRLLETPAEDCLVIEDSPSGVEAAITAGMKCIAVTTPFTLEHLHGSNLLDPQWIVEDPGSLLQVVERLIQVHQKS